MSRTPDEPRQPEPLRLEADALEYTRDGLRTRQGIALHVGRHNRVVIVRPRRVQTTGQSHGGFGPGESFPLCAALAPFWLYGSETSIFAHARGEEPVARGVFQLYAHADTRGDEDFNKQLTDRRAEVVRALLVADVEAFTTVATTEGWGDAQRQAMLRVLGCDPGPIDGDLGPRSAAAVELFQRRYREGDFHRHDDAPPPADPDLVVDGVLGSKTDVALKESFVTANSPHIAIDALHPSHPTHGCGAFNGPASDRELDRRRFSLVVHPEVPPLSENAPCTVGDAQACAVVDDEQQRCMWFREHIVEPAPGAPRFYDPRWLALGEGRYLLSALTTVAPGHDVEFRVFEPSKGWRKDVAGSVEALASPIGECLETQPNMGIVQVVWQAPPSWVAADTDSPQSQGIPVFEVRHPQSGAAEHAAWPETSTVRVLFAALDAEGPMRNDRPETYRLRATNGLYDEQRAIGDAVRSSLHHFALEFHDAPTNARFDLSCDLHREDAFEVLILKDVPFDELDAGCSEGTQCFEEPPPLRPTPSTGNHDHPDAYVPIDDDDTEPALGA